LGKKFYLKHQYVNAIEEYQKATNADPNNDEAYGLMGYSYFKANKIDESLIAFKKSLSINPKNIMSHYNLALVYWANSQKPEAIEEIHRIYMLNPTYEKTIKEDYQFKKILESQDYINWKSQQK
jgi:tetratricopeptide (TPR) repeat protein